VTTFVLEVVDRGTDRGVPSADVYLHRVVGDEPYEGVRECLMHATHRSPKTAEELVLLFGEFGVRVERCKRSLEGVEEAK
jgi:hypothetical protein